MYVIHACLFHTILIHAKWRFFLYKLWRSNKTKKFLYTRTWGRLTCEKQIMWLVEKHEMVHVYFALDLEGLKDPKNFNVWKSYMVSYITTSEKVS